MSTCPYSKAQNLVHGIVGAVQQTSWNPTECFSAAGAVILNCPANLGRTPALLLED